MTGTEIKKGNEVFILRLLENNDQEALRCFFEGLSEETRSRFAPHPLSKEYAHKLCTNIEEDSADRFVLVLREKICAYFILDPVVPVHEADRYRNYTVELVGGKDCMFAPCLADEYQDRGLGGAVMPHLLDHCRMKTYRSLVLLGGTQESNTRAVHFYQKFGFREHGGFHTEAYNLDMRLEL